MTTEHDVERRVAAWLEAGPTAAPAWAVEEALQAANRLPQRRYFSLSTRSVPMFSAYRLIAAAVVAVAIAVGAWRLLPASSGAGAASPSAASLPAGSFTRTVPSNAAGVPAGAWSIAFSTGQLWVHGPHGEALGFQVLSSSATEVRLGGDLNPDLCSGAAVAQYGWTLSATSLTLTSYGDASACRSTILVGQWTAVAAP